MTIGTAVPSAEELAFVPHHFIHNKSIFEPYTVGDFEKEAIEKLDFLFATNDFAILVGGSGLYVDAVLKGFDDFPEVDSAIRISLTEKFEEFGISYLQGELKKLDPTYYDMVDSENPQRLMRALEVSIGSGKPYSSFLNQKKNERRFTSIKIGLEAERQIIYDRINHRVDIMMTEGLLEEARNLYPNKDLNALQTVGYRELFAHFDNEFTLDFAISEIKKNTRRFAKRQLTWFKKDVETSWFEITEADKIINYIIQKVSS